MKIRVLDADAFGSDTPLTELSLLGEVTVYPSTAGEELSDHIGDADVVLFNKVKITGEAMRAAPRLKLLCVFATGYDNVDLAAARECGIAVCNVPGYSTDSVVLFTMTKVLALLSHLKEYMRHVESGEYTAAGKANILTPTYHEMRGLTYGIVGYGNIGSAVGRVAGALGARVIVHKRTPVEGVRCVDLDTLCRESDIISLHCPLNESTRGMIGKDKIAQMKDGVILVNEARGAVVDEAAVAAAVLCGKIGGFGCDVYSAEPFPAAHPYTKLLGHDRVILTPHAAWGALEARVRALHMIMDNIRAFYAGKTENRVDI